MRYDALGRSSLGEEQCLALPRLTGDRRADDPRNHALAAAGLSRAALEALHARAQALHAQGFESFRKRKIGNRFAPMGICFGEIPIDRLLGELN